MCPPCPYASTGDCPVVWFVITWGVIDGRRSHTSTGSISRELLGVCPLPCVYNARKSAGPAGTIDNKLRKIFVLCCAMRDMAAITLPTSRSVGLRSIANLSLLASHIAFASEGPLALVEPPAQLNSTPSPSLPVLSTTIHPSIHPSIHPPSSSHPLFARPNHPKTAATGPLGAAFPRAIHRFP
jgi:hypothetical protein